MRVVGLAGKAGSGKSYLADNILTPENYLPLTFAGPMKAQLMAEEVIPPDEATGRVDKSARTRRILQVFGTELGRDRFHEFYWCHRLEWWMDWFSQHGYDRFVIPDVRFPNELDFIESLGGVVVRVVGRGGLEGLAGEHISETALDDAELAEVDNSPDRSLSDVRLNLFSVIDVHYDENPEPEP